MTLEGPLFTTLETFPIAARGDRLFIGAQRSLNPVSNFCYRSRQVQL